MSVASMGLFSAEIVRALAAEIAPLVREKLSRDTSGIVPRLLSVREAAIYLGRTEAGVRHMIARETIKAARIDGRVQIDRADLDNLIEMSKA